MVPKNFLWPTVFGLCVVGAYGINQSLFDVYIMLVAGFAGFWLNRFGFSAAPIIMGIVLGKMVENSLAQSMIIFDQDATGFLGRPIALILFALALAGLFQGQIGRALRSIRGRPGPA